MSLQSQILITLPLQLPIPLRLRIPNGSRVKFGIRFLMDFNTSLMTQAFGSQR